MFLLNEKQLHLNAQPSGRLLNFLKYSVILIVLLPFKGPHIEVIGSLS